MIKLPTKNYSLRFIPLGGTTDVTKNMYLYELYEIKNQKSFLKEILIIDCGIGFPKHDELGVDLVIPDISYLKNKTDKIVGVVLTHGHEDHTTGLVYHWDALGNPNVYATKLTKFFLENKFLEFGKKINIILCQPRQKINLGHFIIEFISVTHSIPDTSHLKIETPIGNFYHGGDFKLDLTPPYGPPPDFFSITKAGEEGILCLLSDCLGAERPGLTLSERVVGESFAIEMEKTKGKFFMTTFSSNISRIKQCLEAAQKLNRRVCFLGRSMKESTRIAQEIGYLNFNQHNFIKEDDLRRFPPSKLCLIVAGSQGQLGSALHKISAKQHPFVRIEKGDKVVFSSDPIPGNENEVYQLIEELISQGADVVYTDIADQLHSSGHGNVEDIKFLIRFTKPKFFIPIGGTIRHQRQFQKIVEDLGYTSSSVFILDEGQTLWFTEDKAFLGEKIKTKPVYVDAYGVADVGNIVLQDRELISKEGIVFVVLVFNNRLNLLTKPKIFSRGFVFEKHEKDLYEKAINLIQRLTKPKSRTIKDKNLLKKEITENLENLFFQVKGRKPMVIVEFITI